MIPSLLCLGCNRRRYIVTLFSKNVVFVYTCIRVLYVTDRQMRSSFIYHYENTLIQIYRKFRLQILKCSAPNIDCGYSLEPHRRGGSNDYPQSMF